MLDKITLNALDENTNNLIGEQWQKYCQTITDINATRKANNSLYAASGFIEYGKHINNATSTSINEGLYTDTSKSNVLMLAGGNEGESSTRHAVFNCIGFEVNITTSFTFPIAPTNEGSKVDFFGIEFQDKPINNQVYLLGDLSSQALKWDALSSKDKIELVSNPTNNLYLDENSNLCQLVWESKVIDRDYLNSFFDLSNLGIYTKDKRHFYLCGEVPRLNGGIYHPSYNPMGAAKVVDGYWYESMQLTGVASCFIDNIGGVLGSDSGRDDGKFCDVIYSSGQGGVIDYRLSAWDMSSKEEASKVFQKVVNGAYRGKETLRKSKFNNNAYAGYYNASNQAHAAFTLGPNGTGGGVLFQSNNMPTGSSVICYQPNTGITMYGQISGSESHLRLQLWESNLDVGTHLNSDVFTRTDPIYFVQTEYSNSSISGNFATQDVMGDPAEIIKTPELANGWLGGWIPKLGDSSICKLTRKALTSKGVEKYYSLTSKQWAGRDFNINSTNESDKNYHTGQFIYVLTYTAFAKQTKESANKVVLNGSNGLGDVNVLARHDYSILQESLMGKIGASNGAHDLETLPLNKFTIDHANGPSSARGKLADGSYAPRHAPVSITATNNSPACKSLWYQTTNNQQVSLNFAWNELVYREGVESPWGDTAKGSGYEIPSGQVLIVDSTSSYINLNGDRCLAGTAELSIPYGYTKVKLDASQQLASYYNPIKPYQG